MSGKVIVFGSVNLDLVVRTDHHPVPGETVPGSDMQQLPGGKGANQALSAALFRDADLSKNDAGRVMMIGAVGTDDFAGAALANLSAASVDLSAINRVPRTTGTALIVVDGDGENTIVVSPGANALADADQFRSVDLRSGDILLTQQEIGLPQIWLAHAQAKAASVTVVHNAAPALAVPEAAFANMDYLIVNESEALAIAGAKAGQDARSAAHAIASRYSVNLVLTLGAEGVYAVLNDEVLELPAPATNVVDTTGAGDAFCGTFAAALARGHTVKRALEHAVDAGSRACTHHGAQPGLDEN